MTMTDDELEIRLRRDLAELGALPATRPRARVATRQTRPVRTMAVAVTVVLALVAASVAIVSSIDHRTTTTGPQPRVHTILEQPSDLTGSPSSIVAKPFTQVCEKWRELPTGVDCTDLQARYVWSPGATSGPYTFGAIEVVGNPDLKLAQDGTVKGAYPLFKTVSVRGHRARLFGMPHVEEAGDVVTMVWNERPDLQVWIHLQSDPAAGRYPTTLTNEILAFARGMHPVAIDATKSTYVVSRGAIALQYTQPNFVPGAWTLTWRPRDRRLCVSAESMDKCFNATAATTSVRADDVLLEGCVNAWVGTQGLVFGIAPERTGRITVAYVEQNNEHNFGVTKQIVAPPGAPHLRVFALAITDPRSATVIAQGRDGSALPLDAQDAHGLPPFRNAC